MATNGRTIKWVIGGLVTIFIVVIGAITTLSTKADTKLDKDKLDCSVFNAHKEAQVAEFINVEKTQKQQITSLKEFNKQEFRHVQRSLTKIERRLGIYEPEDPE